MKKVMAVVSALSVLFAATAGMAFDTCGVDFSTTIGGYCLAPGGDFVTFLDTGADTDTQSGALTLQCSTGITPIVTSDGNGAGPGYDFSGAMVNGADQIPFTAFWTATPDGAGIGTNILWTFQATATGMQSVPQGVYSTTLTFTINP